MPGIDEWMSGIDVWMSGIDVLMSAINVLMSGIDAWGRKRSPVEFKTTPYNVENDPLWDRK